MNVLMEEIRKYAGIINEENSDSYSYVLDKFLCKWPTEAAKLEQIPIEHFNDDRIKKCKDTGDLTFNYKSKTVFVNEVLNWFITRKKYVALPKGHNMETSKSDAGYTLRLIRRLAREYFDKRVGALPCETEADKDARDRQKKLDYADNYPRG